MEDLDFLMGENLLMNAVLITRLGGPQVLKYQETDRPELRSTEVLIRVAAASVNFADIKARNGGYHGAGAPPFIPGIDVAGTIVAVGVDVTIFQVGQRVIAFPRTGSYAEYTAADQLLTFSIPDSIDFETAAACPIVSFTSYNVLHYAARIRHGEIVLIHAAAGGVGSSAVQIARWLGAKQVIGTVGSDDKIAFVRESGADTIINYNNEDFARQVHEVTNGNGADVILDSLGGEIFEQSLTCLARFGRLVNIGGSTGKPGHIASSDLSAGCRSVIGYSFGTNRKFHPETVQATAEKVLPLIDQGHLKMHIDKRFHLSEANKAHEWVEQRRNKGKVLLLP